MTPRVGIAAIIAMLLLAGCSNSSEGTSTTAEAMTTQPPAAPSTSTTVPDAPTTTAASTTTAAVTDSTAVPTGVLVANESGVVLLDGETAKVLLDAPASIAVDDLMGGLVFQGPSAQGGYGEPLDTIVWWLPADAGVPRSLLVPTGEQRLRLVGVESIDGSPAVVYIRFENPGDFDNAKDTLRLFDLDTAEVTEIRTVGGWESGAAGITFGEGIFASNWFGEAYSGFDFFDTTGNDVTVSGDPYGDAICFDGMLEPGSEDSGAITGGPCFDNVAIAPDGSQLAYTTIARDDEGIVRSLDLVVVSTDDGSEVRRIALRTEEPFSLASLHIRGDIALVNQRAFLADDIGPAEVIDLRTGATTRLAVSGVARFAESLAWG